MYHVAEVRVQAVHVKCRTVRTVAVRNEKNERGIGVNVAKGDTGVGADHGQLGDINHVILTVVHVHTLGVGVMADGTVPIRGRRCLRGAGTSAHGKIRHHPNV